jgi:hypothetical protein
MVDGAQQHEQARPDPWHNDDRKVAAARLELALQRDPNQAEQWCQLGELYDALACDAPDKQAALTYREKAVAALMQAISRSAGMAKAHYALANVYRRQDMRLALVEFEAAANSDPQQYEEALAHARQRVRACTYRVGELKLIVLGSAQEKPRSQILQAEFYFEDYPIASAVLHTCASEGGRQLARCWLFKTGNPDLLRDRPVAELLATSAGKASVERYASHWEPIQSPAMTPAPPHAPTPVGSREAAPQQRLAWASVLARAAAPLLPRKSRPAVWIMPGLILVAVAGVLFAYHTLFAPAPDRAESAGASGERRQTSSIHAATEPLPKILERTPDPMPPDRADHPVPARAPSNLLPPALPAPPSAANRPAIEPQYSALAPEPRASARADKAAPVRRDSGPPPRRTAERPINARPAQSSPVREQAIAPRARQEESPRLAADAPVGTAATETRTAEVKRYMSEPLATAAPLPKEHAVPVPPPTGKRSAGESAWVPRMRAELTSCGTPGLWRADLCREAVRWNYCAPDRWDTVRECAVERFASSNRSE